MPPMFYLIAAVVALIGLLVVVAVGLTLFAPWVRAIMNGVPVSTRSILGMRLRGTPARLVIDAYIQLHHRGSAATLAEVERQFIANQRRIRGAGDLVDFVEQEAEQTTRQTS